MTKEEPAFANRQGRERRVLDYGAGTVNTCLPMKEKHRHTPTLSRVHSRRRNPRKTEKEVHYRIAAVKDLRPGESMKFLMPIQGVDEECFIVNYDGKFHAYVNRCRHVPMAMDWVDNQFFAENGRYLMCQTHNAYYEPDSGECIVGPAGTCGKFLYRVPLETIDGVIYGRPPVQPFED